MDATFAQVLAVEMALAVSSSRDDGEACRAVLVDETDAGTEAGEDDGFVAVELAGLERPMVLDFLLFSVEDLLRASGQVLTVLAAFLLPHFL